MAFYSLGSYLCTFLDYDSARDDGQPSPGDDGGGDDDGWIGGDDGWADAIVVAAAAVVENVDEHGLREKSYLYWTIQCKHILQISINIIVITLLWQYNYYRRHYVSENKP